MAAAKDYFAILKKGDYRRAVRERWQVDALLSGSFGLTYLELADDQRARAQAAFADFVAAPFASKRVAESFKNTDLVRAIPTVLDDSTVVVALELSGDAGRFKSRNTLLMSKFGNAWRIIDQRQAGTPSIRVGLVMVFGGGTKGPADTIPAVLERAAAETRKKMAAE